MNKRFLLLLAFIFFFPQIKIHAQNINQSAGEAIIHTSDDLKTGNYTDVLSNFFQLAVSDLTSKQRAINFKSTLFAVKAKTNPDLLIDRNYLKQYFARNLQFDFSLGLDQDYHLTSYSAGLTYALINKRDETVATFMNSKVSELVQQYGSLLHNQLNAYLATFDSSAQRRRVLMEIQKGIVFLNETGSTDSIPQAFLAFAKIDFGFIRRSIHETLESAYAEVDKKPLLTISANATSLSSSAEFNSGFLEMVFLQGSNPEIDLRAKLLMTDTFSSVDEWRVNFNFQGGLNIVLFQDKSTNKSLLEAKLQGEYSHIFQGLLPDEDADQVFANAEIRVRVTNNFWIPLSIKYDIMNPNWFGFLNVALNLGALNSGGKN